MFGLDVGGVDSVSIGQTDTQANFNFNSESKVMGQHFTTITLNLKPQILH